MNETGSRLGLPGGFIRPVQIINLVKRPEVGRRVAVAIEAKGHAEGLRMAHLRHLVDLPVAGDAAHPAIHMDGVIEKLEIRRPVNLHPGNRLPRFGAVAHQGQARIVGQHLAVAVHADGGRRDVGVPRLFHAGVAIAAIQTELPDVRLVGIRHRLNRLVADAGVFRREIIPRSGDGHRSAHQQPNRNLQRQPVEPLGKQVGHNCVTQNYDSPI